MSGVKVKLFQTDNGPCPYIGDKTWQNLSFQTSNLHAEGFVSLLNNGFRRSGLSIYHPVCSGCKSCIPIRVDVQNFKKNKGQRRTWEKNKDIQVEHHPIGYNKEDFELYKRYQKNWHGLETAIGEIEYCEFLIETPVKTEIVRYYIGKKLIGVGWLDLLPGLISSVYFVFDPDLSSRRLGIFSILYEINYAKLLNVPWLYLGYWVDSSSKMNYKANFKPVQILKNSRWIYL